jgi:hypothetical protein
MERDSTRRSFATFAEFHALAAVWLLFITLSAISSVGLFAMGCARALCGRLAFLRRSRQLRHPVLVRVIAVFLRREGAGGYIELDSGKVEKSLDRRQSGPVRGSHFLDLSTCIEVILE